MHVACFYRVSVKALVVDKAGKFLLARESDGTWDFLGGGLDHGEDPVVAVKREVEEETGLIVTEVNPKPACFLTAQKADNGIYIANIFYETQLRDLNFRPSDECQELQFFDVNEARQLEVLPNVVKFLDIYTPKD